MIQETIKAVKEAEAKAQQKIKDASVRAQSIISEADKEAENIIRKAETAAGEQAASDMKAAEERAHSTENTVVGQVEEECSFTTNTPLPSCERSTVSPLAASCLAHTCCPRAL